MKYYNLICLSMTEAYRGLKNWLGLKFDYKQSEKKNV